MLRLREMSAKLSQYYEDLDLKRINNANGSTKISSIIRINEAINKIDEFGFIHDEINKLKSNLNNLYLTREIEVIVESHTANSYEEVVNLIRKKTYAVIEATSYAIKEQQENMISIKLPPYMDLKRVAKFISDVENMVKTVIPSNQPTKVVLNNFDTGSNWIEITLSTMENVVIIGDFIATASVFAKAYLLDNIKTRKEIENTSSIEEKTKVLMLKGMEAIIEEKSKLCVKELLQNGTIKVEDIPKIAEYQSHLQVQLVKTANYLVDGAEYRAALNAPTEIEKQFPSNEEYNKIQSEAPSLFIENIENDDTAVEDKSTVVKEEQESEL